MRNIRTIIPTACCIKFHVIEFENTLIKFYASDIGSLKLNFLINISESSLPTTEDVGPAAPVRLIYHDYGGHCGFIAEDEVASHGWLAEEMARALLHIHLQHTSSAALIASPVLSDLANNGI